MIVKLTSVASLAFLLFALVLVRTLAFQSTGSIRTKAHLYKHVPVTPISSNFYHQSHSFHIPETVTSTSLGSLPLNVANLGAPLGSMTVLAFVILIHEAGHFLAARSFGISVSEFSIGVGPKLAGFVQKEDENDEGIEFNLRAIPLGGFVRFPENYNATLEFEFEQAAAEKRKEIQDAIKKNGGKLSTEPRSLIRFLINKMNKKRQEEEKAERLEAIQSMGIKLKNEDPKSDWFSALFSKKNVKSNAAKRSIIIEEDGSVSVPPVEYYSDPDLLQNRDWVQRAIVLVGGVVFNILLAWSVYFGELTVGTGIEKPIFSQGAVVSSIPKEYSASQGILNRGDIILSCNGKPLSSADPTPYNAQDTVSSFISTIRSSNGETLHLSVLKYNAKSPADVDLTPRPMNVNDSNSPLSIGVMIAPNCIGKEYVKASSPSDAVVKASVEVSQLTYQTTRGILQLLGSLIVSGGAPAGTSLSGPVGVIKTGSEVVSSKDFSAVLGFAAAISINLAVVNSLPLPALDGGQLVFVAIEALTGKKVDQKKQEGLTAAALFFLLLVSVGTTIGDVSSLVLK
jgi:membrane-associated protease RseP (regulator of RpoE activity)